MAFLKRLIRALPLLVLSPFLMAISFLALVLVQLFTRRGGKLADVAQGVPSGPVPAVSRLVSTPVRGRDTGSEASVGMSADAAGKSACATPGGDLTGTVPLLRVPRHQGRRGHPIWFSRELIAEFLGLQAFGAARDIVRAHAAQTEFLDVDDPGILADIDDAAAYGRLTGAAL